MQLANYEFCKFANFDVADHYDGHPACRVLSLVNVKHSHRPVSRPQHPTPHCHADSNRRDFGAQYVDILAVIDGDDRLFPDRLYDHAILVVRVSGNDSRTANLYRAYFR